MTFLLDILLAPVTLPTKGVVYIFRQVAQEADKELNDPARIHASLLDLQQRVEDGELSTAEYEAAEAPLLARLDEIERRRTEDEEHRGRPAPVAHSRKRIGS
jgi:gas vesicle protein GvpG